MLPLLTAAPEEVKRVVHRHHHEDLISLQPSREDQARLRSIACRTSGAYLDTIPMSKRLSLSDSEFVDACQFRMGATGFVPDAPPTTCECGATLQGNEAAHAMSCKHIGTRWVHYRHDILTAALRNAMSRARLSSTPEPLYAQLDGYNAAAGSARGDIYTTLTPGPGPTAVDTVVTHPGTTTNLSHHKFHTVPGAAAAAARPIVSRGSHFLHLLL
jgi:hypothetical protein